MPRITDTCKIGLSKYINRPEATLERFKFISKLFQSAISKQNRDSAIVVVLWSNGIAKLVESLAAEPYELQEIVVILLRLIWAY